MLHLDDSARLSPQHNLMGCALVDERAASRILQQTDERDYTEPCLTIYRGLKTLQSQGQPLDPVVLAHKLGQEYIPLLSQLMVMTPSAAVTDHYIHLCRQQSRVRALRELGQQMVTISTTEEAETLSQRYEELRSQCLSPGQWKVRTLPELAREFQAVQGEPQEHLPWPLPGLEGKVFAEPGDLIILGGYPSAGKSALALQCAAHWSWKKRVGFYSLETAPQKLFTRLLSSMQTALTLPRLKGGGLTPEELTVLSEAGQRMEEMQLEIVSAAGMTVAQIAATARERGHEIIIVDYLQLLQGEGGSRYEQVTNISLALHTLAQKMSITILALSQLRRPPQPNAAPGMGDLRESGQIEQDADLIMLLYPEDAKNPDGDRLLSFVKNKEGQRLTLRLAFYGQHQCFTLRQ